MFLEKNEIRKPLKLFLRQYFALSKLDFPPSLSRLEEDVLVKKFFGSLFSTKLKNRIIKKPLDFFSSIISSLFFDKIDEVLS